MTLLEAAKQILTGQKPLIDIWHYLVGNYRYKLYYRGAIRAYDSKHPLMRQHIWEQIKYRIRTMNPTCYRNGSCIKCGCNTTELQMADKSCKGACYPTMMNRDRWEIFKKKGIIVDRGVDGIWIARSSLKEDSIKLNDHILYKNINNEYVPINRA